MKAFGKNDRGIALIITILVVSLIIALSIEFNRNMRIHVVSAGNVSHGLNALYSAKSGIAFGLSVLKEDPREFDSLKDDWALAEKMEILNGASEGLLGGGTFKLVIEDLSGKIPINLVVENEKVEKIFRRLLEIEAFDLDTDTVNTILDSTMDWIDGDNEDELYRLNGAENDFYQSMDNPYNCKNGPLDTVEEFLLVKGITPEIFYGTQEKPGLGQCITVFWTKETKINVNTSDSMVLESLSNDFDGETLKIFREDATEAELESGQWYKDGDKINKEFLGIVSIKSQFFQLVSEGRFGDFTKKVIAVVKRKSDTGDIYTLSWRIE